MLIASLSTAFLHGVSQNPDVPSSVKDQVGVSLAGGVPFVSDADLKTALDDAGVDAQTTDAIIDENEQARIAALRSALGVVALVSIGALFFTRRIPTRQPGSVPI